ncbi:MAG: response regulator [Candidatus Hydrogenedentes bacterium]|nr:response regulator [Candidatus Hydrogenedentota bacterium]
MATILIVDDDPDFIEVTRTFLRKAGFETDEAATPDTALEKIGAGGYDLVILDVMMPDGFEGFEVARAIREDLDMRELPVLMLTSLREAKKIPYRFAPDSDYLPVDVFLEKPVPPELLVETVQEMLGERRENPEYPL